MIGIPSSIASLSSSSAFGGGGQAGSIGLGFAIPIDEAKDISNQLIKGGSVSHAWLGVTPDDGTVTADGARRDAAVIKEVVNDSPAQKAGLKINDSVIKVDGEVVNSALSLVAFVAVAALVSSVVDLAARRAAHARRAAGEAQLLATSVQQAFVSLRTGNPGQLPPPRAGYAEELPLESRAILNSVLSASAIGSPDTARRQVEEFMDRTKADELMVTAQVYDHQARLRSFELLMEAARQPEGQLG